MEGVMTYTQLFFGWLLQATLIASVVICLILLIQKMLGGKLGPRWCHALWLVLLIRMILPWAPSSRVSLLNLIPSWDRQIQRVQSSEAAEQQGPSGAGQTSDTAEAIPAQKSESDVTIQKRVITEPGAVADIRIESKLRLVSLRRVLPVLWLAGSIVIGIYLLVSNFALWRIVKRDRPLVDQPMLELFEECKAQMGVQSLVAVVPSNQIRSPGLFGFVRPRLLLPLEMLDTATPEEMRYVFLHELAHLRRHDIYLGWLASLLQVLHWFNPLVWFAFYRMRADRELACDALVLARTQKEESQEYGQAIVGLVRRFSRSRPLPAMAGVIESRSQLKRRITMITEFKNNSYRWSPLAAVLIIILACISLPDAKRTKASGISAAKSPMMVVRRVWVDTADPYFMGAPSPDGKYLSYVDWESGDLAVRELASGKSHRLTKEGWGKGRPTYSIFSPDSKYVACRWRGKDSGGLRIIGLDGSERRFIKHPEGITILRPTNWSTDGKYILAHGGAMWDDSVDVFKFLKILFVSVEDGDARVLKTIERPGQFRMSLSPDGRYVAYSFPPADNSGKGDIWVFGTDGGPEIQLVEHPADDFVLAWSPDGNRIVFASDRTGTMGIWAIDVSDGKAQGAPQLLKSEIDQFHPMGFSQDGAYYYGTFSGGSNVYTAAFNPEKGDLSAKPVIAVRRYEGSNWAPDWSPDGRYLACLSSGPGAAPRFVIQSMETGEVREITPELKEFNVHSLRWSADGRSLLGAGSAANGPWGALQIDVKTGEVTTIAQGPAFGPESAPDDKAIFYVRNVRDGGRIVRHDPATGEEKELYSAPGVISKLALSPNGREFAFFESGALKVLPATGGELRELAKVEDIATIAWTRDGRYLLYGEASGDKTTELWRIAAEGGEPQKLDLAMRGLGHLRFHPDGRQITFRASPQGEKSEVWVMENFLPEAPVAKPAPALVVRQIWTDSVDPYFNGAPSPDGKYLTYVDHTTGDLAVRELATGKNRRLTNEGWEKGFASNSVFSPDGKQVAYYWMNYEEGAEQGPELRIVGLDGSGPRVIRLNKGRFVEMPTGWSADGKHILALGGTEDKTSQQILLIPVEDGDLRVLKTLPKLPLGQYPAARRKVGMSLSPDGRYVAYTFPSEKDSPKCDIFLLAADGSGEIALVEHPADDFVLAWAPDGKQVVFASDRTGSMGVWAVEVADGKTQGDPQLLKPEIGRLYPLGLTRNGSYYYGIFSGGCNIYVAPFDPQEGNIAGEPALTIQRHWGSNWAPAWSPDGRYLACVSSSPDAGPERRFAPPYHFLIRSMETGEVRELSPELMDFDVHSLSWFPDGRSLLGAGKTKKDVRPGILKIDVETGNATTIGTRGGRSPNSAPDGKTIFDVHGGRNGWGIYRHDLTTGEKELVFRAAVGEHGVGAILGLALSPDGKQLAFQDHSADKLKVLSVAGGQPRELVKFEGKATIAWTPDGSHLLYANWLGESPAELWRIPVEGGEPRKVDLEMAYLDHIRFHPNGRQITFTGKAEGDKIEVWVMENFLPQDLGK